MYLVLTQLVNCVGTGCLRYEESWRIKQPAVVHRKFAAHGCFEPEADPGRVGPQRPKVLTKNVIGRNIGRIKNITDASKDIAAVIKRYEPDRSGYGNAGLEIYDRHRITAKWYGERR